MSESAKELFHQVRRRIEGSVDLSGDQWYHYLLQLAEERIGVPKIYICVGLVIFVVSCVVFGIGAALIGCIITTAYPLFHTIASLEQQDSEQITRWLTFWAVYGCFRTVESILDNVTWWIPGYGIGKGLFIIWCYAPVERNGTDYLYQRYIRPAFLNNAHALHRVDRLLSISIRKILAPKEDDQTALFGTEHPTPFSTVDHLYR